MFRQLLTSVYSKRFQQFKCVKTLPFHIYPIIPIKNDQKRLYQISKKSNYDSSNIIYTGPLAQTAKKLKTFSIISLAITFASTPIFFMVDTVMVTSARAIMVLFCNAASTGLIHWCVSPYVARIYYNLSSKNNHENEKSGQKDSVTPLITPDSFLTFETLNLFGKPHFTTLQVKSLEPSTRIFTNWKVKKQFENNIFGLTKSEKKTNPKRLFYIHPEIRENNLMLQFFNSLNHQS
ncbi:12167_t:CDS:2 [Dentiscutata heterogama]|uniref:12167_t:CDS:1 n=1 Tax=Dentiscutata heterogama TaxID=1316150 RepID=A0ACA9L798_9GLOM|nr:12167_t:CDS:2 [Dentiscutata heterogama]